MFDVLALAAATALTAPTDAPPENATLTVVQEGPALNGGNAGASASSAGDAGAVTARALEGLPGTDAGDGSTDSGRARAPAAVTSPAPGPAADRDGPTLPTAQAPAVGEPPATTARPEGPEAVVEPMAGTTAPPLPPAAAVPVLTAPAPQTAAVNEQSGIECAEPLSPVPTSHACAPIAIAESGASGDASADGRGGDSGHATSRWTGRPPSAGRGARSSALAVGLRLVETTGDRTSHAGTSPALRGLAVPPVTLARTGAGGAATASAATGSTGNAMAAASCEIALRWTDIVVEGDLTLLCQAIARASSGTTGHAESTAVAGGSGDGTADAEVGLRAAESRAGRSGRVVPVGAATTGNGGNARATAMTGDSGDAAASASCDFLLVFTRVTITGNLSLLCALSASATSGDTGSLTAVAEGGASGTAVVAGVVVGSLPGQVSPTVEAVSGRGGSARASGRSGVPGAARGTTDCSFTTTFLEVMIGGLVRQECDSASPEVVGSAGSRSRTSLAGLRGTAEARLVAETTPGQAGGLAALRQVAGAGTPAAEALTGPGGRGSARARSGPTGNATALATCGIRVTSIGWTTNGDLVYHCMPTSIARSGNSGAAQARASGGASGDAAALAVGLVDVGLVDVGVVDVGVVDVGVVDVGVGDGGLPTPGAGDASDEGQPPRLHEGAGVGTDQANVPAAEGRDDRPLVGQLTSTTGASLATLRVAAAGAVTDRQGSRGTLGTHASSLPSTGSDSAAITATGGGLLLSGLAALLLGRRPRRAAHRAFRHRQRDDRAAGC